jgi:biotin carboxyl carrier protein
MDLETVEQIVALLSSHPVSEIVVERDGFRVQARKSLLAALPTALPLPLPDASVTEALILAAEARESLEEPSPPEARLLTAGMVGLFRHTEPPLGYGAIVAPGQVIGSIEAMKVLNDVRAEFAGQVVDVFAEEGAPVEYGQALFRLLPG